MRVLAIITARGGSKGLPGKNIKMFNGHPLIAWSINRALKCKKIDKVIVSTDDEKIAAISREYRAEVPFMRPAHLSSDSASSLDVVLHALDALEANGETYDAVVLLQPTSPLRLPGDLERMLAKLESEWNEVNGCILVAPMKPSPAFALTIDDGQVNKLPSFKELPRQSLPAYYASYGLGWAVKTETLRLEKTFYPTRMSAVVATKEQAVDIDDPMDFSIAEAMCEFLSSQGLKDLESLAIPLT